MSIRNIAQRPLAAALAAALILCTNSPVLAIENRHPPTHVKTPIVARQQPLDERAAFLLALNHLGIPESSTTSYEVVQQKSDYVVAIHANDGSLYVVVVEDYHG